MITQQPARLDSEYNYERQTPLNPGIFYLCWIAIGILAALLTQAPLIALASLDNFNLIELVGVVLGVFNIILVALVGGLLIDRAFGAKWYLWAAVTIAAQLLLYGLSWLGTYVINTADNSNFSNLATLASVYFLALAIVYGLVLGGPQAWVLSRTTRNAFIWVIGLTIIHIVVALFSNLLIGALYEAMSGLTAELTSGESLVIVSRISLLITSILETLLTGLVLVFLLISNRNRRQLPERSY